jgi:hypothetical protein
VDKMAKTLKLASDEVCSVKIEIFAGIIFMLSLFIFIIMSIFASMGWPIILAGSKI